MRIRMLKNSKGADDGFTVRDYLEGTDHNLGHSVRAIELAHVFVKEGWAEQIPASAAAPKVRRLPLLEEFVAAGYAAASYDLMLQEETAAAEVAGQTVEVRAKSAVELEFEAQEKAQAAAAVAAAKTEKPAKPKGK